MNEALPIADSSTLEQSSDFERWEAELEEVEFAPEEIELVDRVSPTRQWPESDATGIPTDEQIDGRLAWRAGNAEHALDVVRDSINSESAAKMWAILKLRAIELQGNGLYLSKFDDVNALGDEVEAFVSGFDFNQAAYESVSNK